MPPRKRPAETAPDAERPAKRQTRSSAKVTPAPAPPVAKTRRAQATTPKRAMEAERDEDIAQVDANTTVPPQSRPRTKSKAQPTSDSLLADETNLVRQSAVKSEPKPRRGRPPKKKDVEERCSELQFY